MYTRPDRRRASLGLAGAHARQILADYHDGTREEFLRRHEVEAQQATQGSRRDREQFAQCLLRRAGDTRNVMLAVEQCASRGQAAGPNGLRSADLDTQARWQLATELGHLIQDGTFLPSKPRTVWIDKGAGRGRRPIRIQNFEDRVAERSVLQVIRSVVEPQFLGLSLGFRYPGHSREKALATAERLAHDLGRWVWINEDVKDAFENVPTGRLLQILRRMIPAEDICSFIGRITTTSSARGIRQGGPLSPTLLNVYLHWTLDKWWRKEFSDSPILRVADDLLILARLEEAECLYEQLARRSRAIGMPLKGNPDGSIRNLNLGRAAEWLGYRVMYRDAQLRITLARRSWDKLEDHLRLAWEEPIPSLSANDSIRGWIGRQGASYNRDSIQDVYTGITGRAREQGFSEIPEREEITSLWYGAYLRDWIRERRDAVLADGFADQHCDLATSSRRSDVARLTDVPPQIAPIRREVCLYCDGSCLSSRGAGAWAYLLVDAETGHRQYDADSHPRTTNNRMELTAVIRGLAALSDTSRVHVVVDSEYVFGGITTWLPCWISRGWRKRSGGRVANQRLWQQLAELLDRHEVDCQKVPAHSGHPENEFVDMLAREAARRHIVT